MKFNQSSLKFKLIPYSMKYRLLLILLLVTIIPILLIGGISYYSIQSILHNKIERAVYKNLSLEKQNIEGMLENLDYASKQLALDGKIGDNLRRFISAEGTSRQMEYKEHIDAAMTLTHFTNPNLGLMAYYLPDSDEYLFGNLSIDSEMDIFSFPVMAEKHNIIYYGPHRTVYRGGSQTVFSVIREITADSIVEVDIPLMPVEAEPDDKIYIYMETNFKVFKNMLNSEQYGFGVRHLLLDTNNRIMYSDIPEDFAIGQRIEDIADNTYMASEGHYLFGTRSEKGWSLVAVINQKDFNHEIMQWVRNLMLVGIAAFLLCLLLGWSIWRMTYRPIAHFKKEFRQISNNNFEMKVSYVNIMEYDDLLNKFQLMKERIQELLYEVEQKEKTKRHLEVDKLMHQINPHFLHNTLNTIQWIAAINKQEEIVRLISAFTRVLHYNLDKSGRVVTVHNEIEALKDYLLLQQIRYNHKFEVNMDADADIQSVPVPRFLLQPLVENAIYHGFKQQDGSIAVSVKRLDEEHIQIVVEDNGEGMTEKTVQELLSEERSDHRGAGFGIGLNYVNQMIQVHYGSNFRLKIESTPGKGTRMIIVLPTTMKEVDHD